MRKWNRRQVLKASAALAGFLGLPAGARETIGSSGGVKPLHVLWLQPPDLLESDRLDEVIRWASGYVPQTNIGDRGLYDPGDPKNKANNKLLTDRVKIVQVPSSTLGVSMTDTRGLQIKEGVAKAHERGDPRLSSILAASQQYHTTAFDHPDAGMQIPNGWKLDWVATVSRSVEEEYRQKWRDANTPIRAAPSVQAHIDHWASRDRYPVGWVRKTGLQYTIVPDLRIEACRVWLANRIASIAEDLGLQQFLAAGKGYLQADATVQAVPGKSGSPWLPGPYPGDTYRDANDEMLRLLSGRGGLAGVSVFNTGTHVGDRAPSWASSRGFEVERRPIGQLLHGYGEVGRTLDGNPGVSL